METWLVQENPLARKDGYRTVEMYGILLAIGFGLSDYIWLSVTHK